MKIFACEKACKKSSKNVNTLNLTRLTNKKRSHKVVSQACVQITIFRWDSSLLLMDVSNLCWMEPVEKLKCQFVMSENRFFSIDKNDQRHWQHTAQSEASVVSAGSLETSQRSFPSRVSPLSSERLLQNCRAIPHQFARVQWQITARAFTEFIINSQSRSGQTRA